MADDSRRKVPTVGHIRGSHGGRGYAEWPPECGVSLSVTVTVVQTWTRSYDSELRLLVY